jgi:hypothetical protein
VSNARPSLALVEVPPGALLLNLDTGVLFQLNDSAAFVWKALLRGDAPDAITAAFARRYGLASDDAARDVAASGAMDLTQPAAFPPTFLGFNYVRQRADFLFEFQGEPVLRVDDRGTTVSLIADRAPPRERLDFYLQAIVPKIAALRGGFVLHGSAFVGASGGITIACGASGSGKTTTARACAAAGAELVSEDKVVLAPRDGEMVAVLDGERRLESWVPRAAASLEDHGSAQCGGVDAASEGPTRPIEKILLVDAGRRSGETVELHRLDAVTAAANLFHNVFFGSDSNDDWNRVLETCAEVSRTVPIHLATMPAGLPALRSAVGALLTEPARSR